MPRRADISLLFDFFVTSQRLRHVLSGALADSGMWPDEYAVYSLVFERAPITATEMSELLAMPLTTVLDYLKAMRDSGHLQRRRHPQDGRARQLMLSRSGRAAQARANRSWEGTRRQIEDGLGVSVSEVRRALRALDHAAAVTEAGIDGWGKKHGHLSAGRASDSRAD